VQLTVTALVTTLSLTLLSACSTKPNHEGSSASTVLPPSVKWQTQSKEYPLITRAIYRDAALQLMQRELPTNWVVVMDVDETVLDNSGYQAMLSQSGQSYSTASWNQWVKSKQAKLVPGASDFITSVVSAGGKVALVTNRNKQLDSYTWQNLEAMGLPINTDNTCLMGRSQADKDAVDGQQIVNDKDLRRQQLMTGDVDCYNPSDEAVAEWSQPHNIVMQVGDNIEDIAKTTQASADPSALLPRFGKDIVILPNPMYGSW